MIATLEEAHRAKKMFEEARDVLGAERIKVAENFQVGIMLEIPAVALLAEQFAQVVDFFSIGTNDLTQYTFVAEQDNKCVSQLNDPCHPAVLHQINMVVQAAHANGKWIGVCGEMASDTHAIPILVGLGVDELSVTPGQVPLVKQAIRNISLSNVKTYSQRSIELDSAKSVRELVDEIPIFER